MLAAVGSPYHEEGRVQTFILDTYRAPLRNLELWHVELVEGDFSPHEFQSKRIMAYGEWFTPDEASTVEAMALCPGFYTRQRSGAKDMRFADLGTFTRLKFLSVPAHLLRYVDLAGVAGTLEQLHISDAQSLPLPATARRPVWPMPRTPLPRLRTLELYCPPVRFEPFHIERYPSLTWCGMDLDNEPSTQFLSVFDASPALAGVGLAGINGKKLSLAPLRKDLRALRLQDIQTRQFDFAALSAFTSLQYLEIADSRTPFDCRRLRGLPVEELVIEACDELEHAQALLELPLKKLSIRGRVRPYTKDMPKTLPAALHNAVSDIELE